MTDPAFTLHPIGRVQRVDGRVLIALQERFRPGLKLLGHFSHVLVLWWAQGQDNPESRATLTCEPPYAPGRETGVFACRSPYRPNPIALTVCRILAVDEAAGTVQVTDIDAFDDTPVIDLKAYFPVTDRVRRASIPAWLEGWPEWLPEEGIGLS